MNLPGTKKHALCPLPLQHKEKDIADCQTMRPVQTERERMWKAYAPLETLAVDEMRVRREYNG